MRLYTRGQVVLFTACAVVVASLAAYGFGVFGQVRSVSEQAPLVIKENVATAQGSSGTVDVSAPRTADAPIASANLIQADTASAEYTQDERENIFVYEKYNEGVVNITTEVVSLNYFLEPVPQAGGTGSGSIIDERGYVLTNHHVVKDAYKVFVNLADGNRYEGNMIGVDPENDLAVLKIDPPKGSKLTVIPYGGSANLKVGQKVLAIGNPFGLDRTLTQGIISAKGRPIQQDESTVIRDMIQTDASINPGNSGGPLLNSRGEMIGINTMIYSPSGGSIGIGFAVPVDTAKRVVPDLIKFGAVKRGWIEAEYVQIFPALVEYMKEQGNPMSTEQGLLVSQAKRGGNADRAGMRGGATAVRYYRNVFYVGGDVIVAVDSMKVTSIADLYAALEDKKPGDTVTVEYYRGGTRLKTSVVLTTRASAPKK